MSDALTKYCLQVNCKSAACLLLEQKLAATFSYLFICTISVLHNYLLMQEFSYLYQTFVSVVTCITAKYK